MRRRRRRKRRKWRRRKRRRRRKRISQLQCSLPSNAAELFTWAKEIVK